VLDESVTLAKTLMAFPQDCMLADRRSAYFSSYDSPSYERSFEYELAQGMEVLDKAKTGEGMGSMTEVLAGAAHFITNKDIYTTTKKSKL
jgi:hypothetical protein